MANPEPGLIVVGIGASAGGLESLKEFFAAIPDDCGLAFVVIQHLAPSRASYMADILQKGTKMRVVEAKHNLPIEANSVYTIPSNRFLKLEKERLCLAEPEKTDGLRMPIDFFFRSLAETQHERAICLLLSGSGSDGTLGLREVRAAGGLTIVQKPETAQFDAMLRSAIATGMVDLVLPIREIAEVVQRYVPQIVRRPDMTTDREKLEQLDSILDLLTLRSGNDFSSYKKPTLLRRTERRMGINHQGTFGEYVQFLMSNPAEVDALAKDMLISVSSFFRDPEAFEELANTVVKPLVQKHPQHSPIRVWIPACSTGEEAYSVAMLFLEELAAANRNIPLQVFASDIDSEALNFAREGIYPHSIANDIPETRLSRFFSKHESHYQVVKSLRDSVIFSVHNLLSDAPFSRLDLISCRNFLIYVEPVAQRRLIALFAFALTRNSYLFLGKSDAIATQDSFFVPVSTKWRIYRRTAFTAPALPELAYGRGSRLWSSDPGDRRPGSGAGYLSELIQDVLLERFNTSVVLVDEHGSIRYFFGPTAKYLEHPTGEPNSNLLSMIGAASAAKIRIGLRRAIEEQKPIELQPVEITRGESRFPVQVTISPVPARGDTEQLYAVMFQELPEARAERRAPVLADHVDETLVAQLESELKTLRSEFQATINEYETSAEELKAANEEILSINEELQSTNEELETSKEEIQSVNEELNTVNNELNSKIEQLSVLNNDLVNFVNSSEVATIFLDRGLRIKRFTPATSKVFNIISSDLGRPLGHLTHHFSGLDLVRDAQQVLDTMIPIKKEVQASDQYWYAMTCLPYRTLDHKIDGVILTFNDVTALKVSEISMRESRNFAESIIDTVNETLLVLDENLRVIAANSAFYETVGLTAADVQNRLVFEIGNGICNHSEVREALKRTAENSQEISDLEIQCDLPRGRRRLLVTAKPVVRESSRTHLILLAIQDITERDRIRELMTSQEQMRQHNQALEQQLIASGRLVSLGEITASMAHEFNNPLGVIMGFVEDLLEETDPSSPQYHSLRIIDEETKRCEKIIQDLMQFARPGSAQRRQTYIHAVIDTTLHMMESRLYKQKVTLARSVQPDLPAIEADPQQLEQVLINLYLNAIDAMPEGGTLTVYAAMERTAEEPVIALTVKDTGRGMTADEVKKIFQPFYTANKKTGLGLGLPICERIIKNHGGRIEIESEPGKGTIFKLILPLSPPPPDLHDEPIKIRFLSS
jgi:two-component system, chemotaxis family, CheB/CheR fusion protein